MEREFQADIDRVQNIAAVRSILDVVCRATGMRFSAVARVTEERWIACAVNDDLGFGLAAGEELDIATTLCNEVRERREVIVFDDAHTDPIYADHHTPRHYGLRSYIAVPIVLGNGEFFGTLCAIDSAPAKINNPQIIQTFQLFAELIANHLAAIDRLATVETSLLHERDEAELREQFIAVLGHDLRNPLASVKAGANLLQRHGWTERAPEILSLINGSLTRMAGLIDNLMDFAHARLGGGIPLNVAPAPHLAEALTHVIDEIRVGHPDRVIKLDLDLAEVPELDQQRIAQLLSNLLANAVSHGTPAGTIQVTARSNRTGLELSVANSGPAIPADVQARLFQPYFRGAASRDGLGLGLFIASQIAQAHGGSLAVDSSDRLTRFTLRVPAGD